MKKNKKIVTGLLAITLTAGSYVLSGCDDPDSNQSQETTYNIEYELNGGTNDSNNPTSYKPSTPTFSFKPATKPGYTFVGWYEESNFQTKVNLVETGERGHMKLYAKFETNIYSITYNLDGGELPQGKTNPGEYAINSANITLINPTKFAYTFLGWKDENTGTRNRITTIMRGSSGNKRYTAMWAKTDYVIDVESRRGTVEIVDSANYDDTVTFEITPDEGYEIIEVKMNDEILDIGKRDFKMPNDNVVLNVEYAPIKYTISYDLDGGVNNENNVTEYTVESDRIELARPTKEGFTFLGWKDQDTGIESSSHVIDTGSTGNKRYIALWSADSYEINTSTAHGDVTIKASAKFGEEVEFSVTPYNGYELVKIIIDGTIYEGADLSVRKFTMPAREVNISFLYKIVQYDVNYVLGEGVINHPENPTKYDVATGLVLQAATKDGYSFEGWYLDEKFTSKYEYASNNLRALTLYPRFVQASTDGVYYETLSEAVEAANENDVVTIFSNIKIDRKIVIDKNLTIAGVDGATIEATEDFQNGVVFSIANDGGSVKFEDITIDANSKAVVILITAGELDLKDTHVTGGYTSSYVPGVYVTGTATFKMNGGSIKGNKAGNTIDYYAVYSTDLWIGSQAAGTVGEISGDADIGNVFVNANEAQSDGKGTLTLNGGNIDLVYVEYDDNRGATFNYVDGTVGKILLSTKTTGTYVEVSTPTKNTTYIGGTTQNV